MSIAQRLGVSGDFLTALLLMGVLLTVAPYLDGATIGSWVVPKLAPRRRRFMRFAAPIALAAIIAVGMPIQALRPSASDLQLIAADFHRGVIDVVIWNAGTSPALLSRIEIAVLRDHHRSMRPPLDVSATYHIALGDAVPGERRVALVRHLVPAGATERLIIAPDTTRVLDVRLQIASSEGKTLARDFQLWRE